MNIIQFGQIFWLLVVQVSIVITSNLSVDEEKYVPIFQPFPSLIVKAKDICQDGNASQLKSFIKDSKIYVAMSMYSCGVIIYDVTDLSNPLIAYQNTFSNSQVESKILGITLSIDERYLFISNSNGNVFVIDLNTSPMDIVSQVQSNNSIPINSIQQMNDNIYIFLCPKSFQVYTWQQVNNQWVFQQSVTVNALNVVQIQFIKDFSYAVVTGNNLGVIFYKLTQSPSLQFTQTCVLKPYFFDVNQFILVGENIIIVMMQYKGVYMYDISNYFSQSGDVCNQNTFKYISQTPSQGLGGMMALSSNKKFLFAQFRSIGVLIYDITQNSFNLVQNLNVEQNSKDVSLCEIPNGIDLFFYSNSDSLQIFKRSIPNFNRDKPNLLLNEYQQVRYSDFKESPSLGSLDYHCIYHEDKQNYYLSRANFGSALFKYRGNGILEYISFINRAPSIYPTSHMAFLEDGIRTYASRGSDGLMLINFSNQSQPVIEKSNITLNLPFVQFNKVLFKSDFSIGFVSNLISIVVFECKDPLNPTLLHQIDTLSYIKDPSCSSIFFSHDQNTLFVQCYSYGIIAVDISDINKISFLSKIYTESVYFISQTSDQKYLLIGTGYKGLVIAEIGENQEMKQISSVHILGAVFQILNMWNDNYVLVTSNENPSIQLINLVDKRNPSVIQRFGKASAFGYYSMCKSRDSSYVLVSSQFELLILQLQNQIILHTQVYELISKENSNEYIRKDMSKDQTLKIGQNIEMHLVPIYQTQELLIKKAQYYQNYVLQELPYWMEYQSSQRILRLTISKDSLKKDEDGNYIETVQQVVFVTYQSVSDSAFINDYLQITSTDSASLKKICINEGILTKDGFVIDSYTPQKIFSLGSNESTYLAKWVNLKNDKKVKNFIQYVINQNIINYTISFTISNSIHVDLENQNQPIYSLQNDITVQMYVVEPDNYAKLYVHSNSDIDNSHFQASEKAKFVKKSYSGILLLLSEKQNELKIEGSLVNVNNILSQGIKFSVNSLGDDSNIYVKIVIADGVNYNYEQILHYKSINFISMQSPVILSEQGALTNDFRSKYPGGSIYIQNNFQYQVSQKVFTCIDEKQLTYTAQIFIDGQFQEIPKDFWLQYSLTDRVFSGTPPATEFQKQYTVQVNATDGYTYAVESFTMTPSLIPFSYALQFAIQILGPLFGVFGFWKYKHLMYNITFKKHYVYTKEIVYVGEFYKKQIPSSNNTRETAINLWKFFLSKFPSNEIYEQIEHELSKQQTNKVMKIEDFLREEKEQIATFSEMIYQKIFPFGVSNKDLTHFNNKEQTLINRSMGLTLHQELTREVEGQNHFKQSQTLFQDTDKVIHLQNSFQDNQVSNASRLKQTSNNIQINCQQQPISQNQTIQLIEIPQQNNQFNTSFQSDLNYQQSEQKQQTMITQPIQPNQIELNRFRNFSSNPGSPIINNLNSMNKTVNLQERRTTNQKDKVAKKIAKNINLKRNVDLGSKHKMKQSHSPKVQGKKILNIFTEDGSINFVEINKFIYEKQMQIIEKKRVASELELQKLLNPNSMLFQAISALMSEYLLSMNTLSKQIYHQMQLKAQKYYKDIDWYKAYLKIDPNFQNININPFPDISIDNDTFSSAIQEICEQINYFLMEQYNSSPQVISQSEKKNNIEKQDQLEIVKSIRSDHTAFSIELIQQAIIGKALGFSMQSQQIFQKTCGETIHTYSHSIHSIKAFERNNDIKHCFKFLKFLDMHYIEKGLTDNERLPSWIQSVDLIHGTILLCGVPEKKDVGSVIFKVFDEDMFIVRSFEIKIIEKEIQNDNNQNIVNLQEVQNPSNHSLLNSTKQKKKISEIINAPYYQTQSSPNQSNNNSPIIQHLNNSNSQMLNNSQAMVQQKRIDYSKKKYKSSFAPDQSSSEQTTFQQQNNQNEIEKNNFLNKDLTISYTTFQPNRNKDDNNLINQITSSPNGNPEVREGYLSPSSSHINKIPKEKGAEYKNKSEEEFRESSQSVQIHQNLIYSQEQQLKTAKEKGLNSLQNSRFGKQCQESQSLHYNYSQEQYELASYQESMRIEKILEKDQQKLLENDSMNASFNPNCQQSDMTTRFLMLDQINHDEKEEFKDISMNFNITERFQTNIEKQEMKDGETDLQISSLIS